MSKLKEAAILAAIPTMLPVTIATVGLVAGDTDLMLGGLFFAALVAFVAMPVAYGTVHNE